MLAYWTLKKWEAGKNWERAHLQFTILWSQDKPSFNLTDSSPKNRKSVITHPHVATNLYEFLTSLKQKQKRFLKNQLFLSTQRKSAGSKITLDPVDFHCMDKTVAQTGQVTW